MTIKELLSKISETDKDSPNVAKPTTTTVTPLPSPAAASSQKSGLGGISITTTSTLTFPTPKFKAGEHVKLVQNFIFAKGVVVKILEVNPTGPFARLLKNNISFETTYIVTYDGIYVHSIEESKLEKANGIERASACMKKKKATE